MQSPLIFSLGSPNISHASQIFHPQSSRLSPDKFSGGSALCCNSTSVKDIVQYNVIFWKKEKETVVIKVWEKASTLGIRGEDEDVVYVAVIKRMEQSDNVRLL